MGGARGDGVADHTHHTGVVGVKVQTQLGEDFLGVLQTAVLPEGKDKRQKIKTTRWSKYTNYTARGLVFII